MQQYLVLDFGGSSLDVYYYDNFILNFLTQQNGDFNILSSNLNHFSSVVRLTINKFPTKSVIISIAGLSLDSDKRMLHNVFSDIPAISIMSDVDFWFSIKFKDRDGTLVILGTGSVFVTKHCGVCYQVGGYGKRIGDPGSGYSIGVQSIRFFLGMIDGLYTGDDVFISALKPFFAFDKHSVIEEIYRKDFPIQSLAKTVLGIDPHKSWVTNKIHSHELLAIENMLFALQKKARISKLPSISFVGGLVGSKNYYSDSLNKLVEKFS